MMMMMVIMIQCNDREELNAGGLHCLLDVKKIVLPSDKNLMLQIYYILIYILYVYLYVSYT